MHRANHEDTKGHEEETFVFLVSFVTWWFIINKASDIFAV